VYKNWVGHISKNWAGHKFDIHVLHVHSDKTCDFTVKPHWYVNEDWDKALEMAKEYIDLYLE
jgi:hypothetical protein